MKISKIVDLISAEVVLGNEWIGENVKAAFGSDLMSDVLAYAHDEAVLITGLMNNQVIRTADMLDLKAIIFVRGKIPTEEVLSLACEHEMVIATTPITLYEASGILYSNGLKSVEMGDK
ncbi:hypothetical protein [Helicovermis profundi]|uniref:DRTGG domain-containing protein n=1 Tax=Helicovermis profundi TaxID=3065157 RepID=A0AAU9E3H9_9FIRM|nr:DRTGG domain-containing protein [Clostridia bacterium S502]